MTSFLASVTDIHPDRLKVRDGESGELVVELADSTHLDLTEELAEALHRTLGQALEARGRRVITPADLVSQLKSLASDLRWDDLAPWAARVDAILAGPAAPAAAVSTDNEAVAR
jgi:hypothetical protein